MDLNAERIARLEGEVVVSLREKGVDLNVIDRLNIVNNAGLPS